MKFNHFLPYPILSKENDNYKNSRFDVQLEPKNSFGQFILEAKFELDNEGLQQLINDGRAVFALHIECPLTSFRTVVKANTQTITLRVEEHKLRGKMDVHAFILANEQINNYTNAKWDTFYMGIPISYEKGNVLAVAEAVEIILHEEPVEDQNLPSIVTIRLVDKGEYMSMELSSNQILILLPKNLYTQYAQYSSSRLKSTIISTIIFPALVDVFHTIKAVPSDFEDNRWYRVLVQVFDKNQIPFERILNDQLPVIEAVQMVLRNPLIASFDEIEKFLGQEE